VVRRPNGDVHPKSGGPRVGAKRRARGSFDLHMMFTKLA
jgi:hypothetical protein